MNKPIVISLGGSLIFPEEIDVKFLAGFKKLIIKQIQKGQRFILITGGGRICRKYQAALGRLSKSSSADLDWMGIFTTQTNSNFVRLMFGKLAHKSIVGDPEKRIKYNSPVLLAAGWEPGWSTDMDAVMIAKTYSADTVINLSNIDYLYTKDPRKFKDAKKIIKISWDGLLKITGQKWNPGANVPFDPAAAQFAQKNKLKVIIANGKNLANLQSILNGKDFQGTKIQ